MSIEDRREALFARIPKSYSGWAHLGLIAVLGPGVIAACVAALDRPRPWEWLFVPGFFVFANAFEWWIHRGPMHHPTRGLRLLYQRHTLEHHVAYTEQFMGIRSHRELMLVLFAPWALPAILVANAPIPLALAWLLSSPNLGYLFYACAVAYYLVYEGLHTLHHLPADGPLARGPLARRLRTHHARHHDPARMTQGNFNVSFPLWDWLLGSTLPPAGRGWP